MLFRVFDIDLEHCPNCGGELKIIAAILDGWSSSASSRTSDCGPMRRRGRRRVDGLCSTRPDHDPIHRRPSVAAPGPNGPAASGAYWLRAKQRDRKGDPIRSPLMARCGGVHRRSGPLYTPSAAIRASCAGIRPPLGHGERAFEPPILRWRFGVGCGRRRQASLRALRRS